MCFVTRDLSTARRIPGPFDRILSIDSLYFTDDIHRTVALLHDALAPDGRLGVLASEVLPADGSDPGPRATPMHRAMVAAGFAVRVTDVTRHEHRIWRRQAEVVRGLEAAFEAEGNGQLALELRREGERSLGWIEEDRIRRYLYVARPARA